MDPNSLKVCALCRHLQTVETGREFPDIVDSEYVVFRCSRTGDKVREDYLMTTDSEDIILPVVEKVCPYWEPATEDAETRFVGLPEINDEFWRGITEELFGKSQQPPEE